MDEYLYDAFISYSHRDLKWGRWLQRKLEGFHCPREAAEGRPGSGRLRIFRDQTDLAGAKLREVYGELPPPAMISRLEAEKQLLEGQQISEVEIRLLTGRHHQIRVQFASRGLPLMGDRKYNPAYQESPPAGICGTSELGKHLCLTAVSLSFTHPKTGKPMRFAIEPPHTLHKKPFLNAE